MGDNTTEGQAGKQTDRLKQRNRDTETDTQRQRQRDSEAGK